MITTRRTRRTTLVAPGDPFRGSKILLTRRNNSQRLLNQRNFTDRSRAYWTGLLSQNGGKL